MPTRALRNLLAGVRVSFQRSRADWPIVAAAWLIMVLAAVLLASGPIYASAASEAGLRRVLGDAPVEDTNVTISIFGTVRTSPALDEAVQAALDRVIAGVGGAVIRDWRTSSTGALPGAAEGNVGDRAALAFIDELPNHATLVTGAWPADSTAAADPLQIVVSDLVAADLGLHAGDSFDLRMPAVDGPAVVKASVVGIYRINEATDPFWNDDPQLVTGVSDNGQYRTYGPFLTTENNLLLHSGVDQFRLQWRARPDFDQLVVDDVGQLRSQIQSLPGSLKAATGEDFTVAANFQEILGTSERSLLVSRTGVLLLIGQLAILAAYALVLTASLLVDHRRVGTSLMRSRGAGAIELALLALEEGLLLAVPAVLVAPFLAVAALNVLNLAGPLADVGLHIDPRVTIEGYVAAAAAGLVCVILLVLPVVLGARGFAAEQGGVSRQDTRSFGQRIGLDIALVGVTAIALWQLRLYGAPLTRNVQGALGLDPLLVAAPAIGLLAGGILALRLLPWLAKVVEAAVARGPDLVASLGSRQMARRPLRYTRSALLLMLSMSMGVFGLSYAATWASSQADQAAYQAGADVRVQPDRSLSRMPWWALPNVYAGLAGVEQQTPVERIQNGASLATVGSADILALDAATAADIVLLRSDESATPLGAMLQTLRDARPNPTLVILPDGANYLRLVPQLQIAKASTFTFNPDTEESHEDPVDPSTLVGIRMSVTAIVRDAHGLLYRYDSRSEPFDVAAPTTIVLSLAPTDDRSADAVAAVGARLDGPVELAGLKVQLWLPQDVIVSQATVGIGDLSTSTAEAGPWAGVPAAVGGWAARIHQGLNDARDVAPGNVRGTAIRLDGSELAGVIFGNGPSDAAAEIELRPTGLTGPAGPIPVIANQKLLVGAATNVGETFLATVAGSVRTFVIAGAVDSFPTTDPNRALMVMDEPTLGLARLLGQATTRNADEWWMATSDGAAAGVIDTLRGQPFDSAEVIGAAERARSLSTDPVALGIIGALALGFVATGLFALVGLTASAAVSARQRRTEFALLRALGLSGRQLATSLWLENGSLVIVSLAAGTSLGLLIGWLVLPFVTVTQGGAVAVPPVMVEVPWDRILILDAVSALGLGVAVVVIGSVLRRLGVGSILRMGED